MSFFDYKINAYRDVKNSVETVFEKGKKKGKIEGKIEIAKAMK